MTEFCNEVNDWLITGGDLALAHDLTGKLPEDTVLALVERGVTHVLDVRSEWSDKEVWAAVDPSVQYCHAPIIDSHRHYCGEGWYTTVESFVREFLSEERPGSKLFVHCHMGINRGPSAAMLALLTDDPSMDPYDAFMEIRDARPVAGLIYAEQVGRRHLKNRGEPVSEFNRLMRDYWTPEKIREVNRGIAYYRSQEGDTITVGGTPVLACPVAVMNPGTLNPHRVKWNSGDAVCLDCGSLAISVPS